MSSLAASLPLVLSPASRVRNRGGLAHGSRWRKQLRAGGFIASEARSAQPRCALNASFANVEKTTLSETKQPKGPAAPKRTLSPVSKAVLKAKSRYVTPMTRNETAPCASATPGLAGLFRAMSVEHPVDVNQIATRHPEDILSIFSAYREQIHDHRRGRHQGRLG